MKRSTSARRAASSQGRPSSQAKVAPRDVDDSAATGGTKARGSEGHQSPTLGWTDCGHDDWRPGIVLDPFAGSGTTLAVAVGHGRNAIGIDLDERNVELARERVGPMFFDEGVL